MTLILLRWRPIHHQDPDLCGLIPFIENILHPSVIVIAHPRTSLLLPYYGLLSFKANLGVMFVDIRNFTEWSAERSPGEVVLALNRQHELVSKIINAGGGRVNKIMGDGLLAYFPENHLDECVRVAIDIQRAIVDNDLLRVGVGCDFGPVTMGDIGEQARLDYTLVGAPVNFASRMCDTARPGEIVITARLDKHVSPEVRAELRNLSSFEEITVQVKENDPELHAFRFAFGEEDL